jgi:hypothetical protein
MYAECPPPTHMTKISANQYRRLETVNNSSSPDEALVSNERVQMENSVAVPETVAESISCVVVFCDDPDSIAPHQSSGEDACFICMEKPQDAVLLECGHSGLCVTCASMLWERERRCPLCRKRIAGIMRIILEEQLHEDSSKVRAPTTLRAAERSSAPRAP